MTGGLAGPREYASAGMGQQVGRVGEAPGLPQPQPRGARGSSAARPSGRRRDPAGRPPESGFNVFTQHGEWRGARAASAAAGPSSRPASAPLPRRAQPGWQLRGAATRGHRPVPRLGAGRGAGSAGLRPGWVGAMEAGCQRSRPECGWGAGGASRETVAVRGVGVAGCTAPWNARLCRRVRVRAPDCVCVCPTTTLFGSLEEDTVLRWLVGALSWWAWLGLPSGYGQEFPFVACVCVCVCMPMPVYV